MYLVYSFRFGEIKKKKRKKKEAKVVSKKYTMGGGGGDPFFRVDLHSGTYAGRRKIYKLEWVLRSREKNEKRWIITRNVHVSFFEHAASFFPSTFFSLFHPKRRGKKEKKHPSSLGKQILFL